MSGWARPYGGRVGGEAAHSATARLPSPPEQTRVAETDRRRRGDGATRRRPSRRRYDNPSPTQFLAPIDCLKISAQAT
jgi:hypothetical protein